MWWKSFLIILVGVLVLFGTGIAVVFAAYPIKYRGEILSAAKEFDIEPDLIAAIIRAESGFKSDAISPRGAVGLMQLLPSTARWISKAENPDLTDPQTNIRLGTMYLRYLLDRFDDLKTALIAYNAGPGKTAAWLKEKGVAALDNSPYPETNAYVKRVLGSRWIYRIRIGS